MKFYTYIHTRADDLKVFYVGKGVGKRARSKAARNAFWNNTVAKHGYIVSICMRFATEVEAHEHEKFLIQCFRGMGAHLGRKNTPETIAKMSAAHKERGMTAENKAKLLAATIARTGAVASANAHKAWATRRAKAAACTA